MKKLRGFRLGKPLVRFWRWVRRRRRLKHGAYVTLSHTATPVASSSQSPLLHSQQRRRRTAVTARIAGWGRSLTRRLVPASAVCSRRGGPSSGEDGDLLLSQTGKDNREFHPSHHIEQEQQRDDLDVDWWKPPPKGHLAVYVGRRGDQEPPRRVLLPVVYFNHPLFANLLREAEEEFGFHHTGGITIPCPVADFESVRRRVAAAADIGSRCRRRAAGTR